MLGVSTPEIWLTYGETEIRRFGTEPAYFYVTGYMALDADGAPNAYNPTDTGLDALENAGYPNKDWKSVLVVDPSDADQPYVQTDGPFAGYFVSQSSLRDETRAPTDPQAYVDATAIAYIVFPYDFYAITGTGRYGSIGIVRNLDNGNETGFVVADGGPAQDPLGEVSLRLATLLGGQNPDPRNGRGAPIGPFLYLIFPDEIATPPWPLTQAEIDRRATARLDAFGGWARITPHLSAPPSV